MDCGARPAAAAGVGRGGRAAAAKGCEAGGRDLVEFRAVDAFAAPFRMVVVCSEALAAVCFVLAIRFTMALEAIAFVGFGPLTMLGVSARINSIVKAQAEFGGLSTASESKAVRFYVGPAIRMKSSIPGISTGWKMLMDNGL